MDKDVCGLSIFCMMRYRSLLGTMNSMFSQPTKQEKEQYYIVVDGKQAGPMAEAELKKLVKNGVVVAETMVWTPTLTQWTPAQNMPAVNKLLLLCAPKRKVAQPTSSPASMQTDSKKHDILAALKQLGISSSSVSAKVDALLKADPAISLELAVKQILKSQ